MRAFTSIEQSKILAEILPIKSADMHYVRKVCDFRGRPVAGKWSSPKYGNINSNYANYILQNFTQYDKRPCWSLVALLKIINKDFYTKLYHDGITWTVDVRHHDNRDIKDMVYTDEPIDSFVEMIVKLNEKGLI